MKPAPLTVPVDVKVSVVEPPVTVSPPFAPSDVKAPVLRVVAPTDALLIVPPVIAGLEIVGDVPRTAPPEPVTAFERAVATPVPRPETPEEMGRPVPFVSVTAEGVPRFGVMRAGEFDSTAEPVPVEVVDPVPPFAAVNGLCKVRPLNVGAGYVWASAITGTRSAVRKIFFIGSANRNRAVVIPRNAGRGGLGFGERGKGERHELR